MLVKKEDLPKPITEAPQYAALDTSKSNEPAYLIRIPEFIRDSFQSLQHSGQVGNITVKHYQGGKVEFDIVFNEGMRFTVPAEIVPSQFSVKMDPQSSLKSQYLFTVAPDSGYVRVAGKVSGTGRFTADDLEKLAQCNSFKRQAEDTKKDVTKKSKIIERQKTDAIKPRFVAENKKEAKDRNLRLSKADLRQKLLSLFNQTDTWAIQDLVKATKQDQAYITETIRQFTDYDPQSKSYRLKDAYKSLQ